MENNEENRENVEETGEIRENVGETGETRPRSPRRFLLPAALLALAVLAGAGLYHLRQNYLIAGLHLIPRDSVELSLRDQGLRHVPPLEELGGLRRADLRGNPLPAEELHALRDSLPECEILCDVPLGGQVYDSQTETLELEDLPEDWTNLFLFNRLRELIVRRCTAPQSLAAVAQGMPECAVGGFVSLGGEWYDLASEELALPPGAADFNELASTLGWFDSLRSLTVPDGALSTSEQLTLKNAYPSLRFRWPVAVGDRVLSSDVPELAFLPGEAVDMEALEEVLPLLPDLKTVDFTLSAVPGADRAAFLEAHPRLDVRWTVELMGETYPWDTELLDFNGVPIDDPSPIEAALPYLPRLKTVEMCDCGLSNEAMDALNRRHEDVKFVWRVYFSGYNLRTDAEYFVASAFGDPPPAVLNQHLPILAYCTELRALDLGHMYITDLSFIQSMPHMTYLILAESSVSDLSPLAGLKELKYIEAFLTGIWDLSPLLECPALEDLNICYTWVGADNAMAVLPEMKQLQRLWWCNTTLNTVQQQELFAALPDCLMFFQRGGQSTGGAWRYHENYYEMRDAFDMWYMPGGTNGVADDGSQIIIDDRGHTYLLPGYDYTYQRWWEDPRYAWAHPYIIGVTG